MHRTPVSRRRDRFTSCTTTYLASDFAANRWSTAPFPAGVIVNMVFPSWLLALLWVAFMAVSNTELVWSLLRLRSIRKEVRQQAQQLLQLDAQAAAGGAAAARDLGQEQAGDRFAQGLAPPAQREDRGSQAEEEHPRGACASR